MQNIDTSNTLFTLASDLVSHTSRHIFLTGKAGTGKTTFLKHIRSHCPKQMAIVAPTGVAAINAGGVTIHSFFQLPFSPFLSESTGFSGRQDEATDKHSLLGKLRLNSERRKVMQELELLVIDEISMVRCDVLDAIDTVLRHVRHRYSERFGGVQLLFIGDMFQLPPVVKEAEWSLLKEHYKTPFFFDSHVMRDQPPVYIEFRKIYRQTEEKFIRLLNMVRNNELDEAGLQSLHERYQPQFFGEGSDGYILLTTHNEKARQVNSFELQKLGGKSFIYKAAVEGDFPSTAFPADETLELRLGAQVMFIKNDTEKKRRYFNGKIGVVTELTNDKIVVQCKGDPETIEVSKEKWENIRYTLDRSSRNLQEDVLGSFGQYPLRLAWAITIHKSQGLTFEKAVIDAGQAFAPGQVYVALSRCTTLDGMVLHSQIRSNALLADERIVQFTKKALETDDLTSELEEAKKEYQEWLFGSLFDFQKTLGMARELSAYVSEHTSSFNAEVLPWIAQLVERMLSLQATADKFKGQIKKLLTLASNVEENLELQKRLKAAAEWFSKEIKLLIETVLQSPASTDSTLHAKEYNDLLRETCTQLSLQVFLLAACNGHFNVEAYQRRKKEFTAPSFGVNAYAGVSERKVELRHPALYYQLKKLRDDLCSKKNLPIYLVAGSRTLEEMATYLPQTLEELQDIVGFGKAKATAYGNDFLSIITAYSSENGLGSFIAEKHSKPKVKETRQRKTDTKAETLKLYQQGKSVEEICAERDLSRSTIEAHLAYYVQRGEIKIQDLLSSGKILLIEPVVKDLTGNAIGPVKEQLGNDVSYGEIRFVIASLEYQRSSAHIDQ